MHSKGYKNAHDLDQNIANIFYNATVQNHIEIIIKNKECYHGFHLQWFLFLTLKLHLCYYEVLASSGLKLLNPHN